MNKFLILSAVIFVGFALFISGCKKAPGADTIKTIPVYVEGSTQGSTQASCPAVVECQSCAPYLCESASMSYGYGQYVCGLKENTRVAVINNGVLVPAMLYPTVLYFNSAGILMSVPDNLPVAVLDMGDSNLANAHAFKIADGATPIITIAQNVISLNGVAVAYIIHYCFSLTTPDAMVLPADTSLEQAPIPMTVGWCPKNGALEDTARAHPLAQGEEPATTPTPTPTLPSTLGQTPVTEPAPIGAVVR
ncbi:MAG: hypothetical protein V1647_01515 [Pseudomonadota bacterium]